MALIKRYGWSLYEIDNTDIESLLPFVLQARESGRTAGRTPSGRMPSAPTDRAFCDQVSWL
jgi:hypothetical protein